MVDIVIPIYKESPTADEVISLQQCFSILENHSIIFIHPKSLDLTFYKRYEKAAFQSFNDDYFTSIFGYNRLMLSVDFYEAFQKEYLLVYQPDCLVFHDTLDHWIAQGYDYIGAPWLRSRPVIPWTKKLWDKSVAGGRSLINYKGNGRIQKDKSRLYNAVGNGGLSLRRREKCIQVLKVLAPVVEVYLQPKNQSNFYAEDVFFSIEPKRNGLEFSKPDYLTACQFAIENKPALGISINEGKLPFGCHRWNKENRSFWLKFLTE